MLILRQKCYTNKGLSSLKKLKESPLLPLTSIGLSATSVGLSLKRNQLTKESSDRQIAAMNELAESLGNVDKTLKAAEDNEQTNENVKNVKRTNSIKSLYYYNKR